MVGPLPNSSGKGVRSAPGPSITRRSNEILVNQHFAGNIHFKLSDAQQLCTARTNSPATENLGWKLCDKNTPSPTSPLFFCTKYDNTYVTKSLVLKLLHQLSHTILLLFSPITTSAVVTEAPPKVFHCTSGDAALPTTYCAQKPCVKTGAAHSTVAFSSGGALRPIFCPAGRLSHEDKAGVANLGPFLFPPAEHPTCAILSIPTIDSSRLLVEFVSGFS